MSAKKKSMTARKVQAGPAAIQASATKPLLSDVRTRIRRSILKEKRAEYAAEIVQSLAGQLTAEFGRGFGEKNLRRMLQFAEVFPDEKIVVPLVRQLGWTHFLRIIPIENPLKRDFYAEMCRIEKWSKRTLASKIAGMLFERTALSKKPDKLIRQELDALKAEDKVTPDLVFRDPYVLDFLGLKDTYAEKDVQAAILRDMEAFILELGVGWWPSNSRSATSRRPTNGRWSSTWRGSSGMNASPVTSHRLD